MQWEGISRQRWMAALRYLGQTCLKERETERGRQVHSQEDLICGKNAKKVCQQSTFRSVLNKIDFNINERGVEQVWRKRISKQGLRID
jgi:hypothetical protein